VFVAVQYDSIFIVDGLRDSGLLDGTRDCVVRGGRCEIGGLSVGCRVPRKKKQEKQNGQNTTGGAGSGCPHNLPTQ